ncbi:hypothetical protein QBC47DRAFT_387193 [Echria macrotheca]|uniref:Uncharacterized protein n=1 Tax=Echria macrotheca TaxID=438768 RepID=A0AAJ0B8V2_9PEZI|nr:hypothetical protein QBC47DRAFT_387193 [Echria macrotheca]
MRTFTLVAAASIALTYAPTALAVKGFHLFDRRANWFQMTPPWLCPRGGRDCANIKEPFDYNSVFLVPADHYSCDVIRDMNYDEKIESTDQIGFGTVLKGQCGAQSLTFFPVDDGRGLEVWEDGRMYGKCYRQDPGKVMQCDSPGDGRGCQHPLSGQPVPHSCKIEATDVWVCPVDLCGS